MSGAPFKSPTWPPDYSSYTSNEDQEMMNVLRTEANSRRAPESYRAFLAKVSRMVAELQLKTANADSLCEEYEKRIDKSIRECDMYAEYLATSKRNYDILFDVLQDERLQRIDLEKKTSDLEAEIEKLKQEQSTRRSVPPPSTPPPLPTTVSVSSSPQQPPESSSMLLQPVPVPSQQPLPNNLHDECQRKLRQWSDKARELERQVKRLATGRQSLEEQLVEQFKKNSLSENKMAQAEKARVLMEQQNAQLHEQLQQYAQMFQQLNGQPPPMGTFQPSQQRHQRPPSVPNATARFLHMSVPNTDVSIPASMHDPQRPRLVFDPSQQHQQ
ncbi:hypothetical protein BJV82DRAFT_653116 [Fennellomyces sp. T-0311]|nr:hypothetical protein BJV82DRAFT_653116 [Fennellomyces sp. T-0311]